MIRKEIIQAKALYRRYGEERARDPRLREYLNRYRFAIENTHGAMREFGLARMCTVCAGSRFGSCCFRGVEEWYDHIILLINLLFGVEVPEEVEIPGGCLFLGPAGCKFLARNSFCVNYLCPTVKPLLKMSKVKELGVIAGKELSRGWELEKEIRIWLRHRMARNREKQELERLKSQHLVSLHG
jgi:hypothetical protein